MTSRYTSVSKSGLLLAAVVLLFVSCLNPTGQEFSMNDSGAGLPDPDELLDIYSSTGTGSESWEVVHDGLPRGNFDAGGMAATDTAVYLAISDPAEGVPGIYRLADGVDSWELYLDGSDFAYGKVTGLRYHPDDDHLYFLGHSAIYRLDADGTGGPYRTEDQGAGGPLELVLAESTTDGFDSGASGERIHSLAVVPDGSGSTIVVQKGDADNPEFYTLEGDATGTDGDASSALSSTAFRSFDAELDGKPHTDLFADTDGNIYFVTNYSGIYRYDGSWQRILNPSDYADRSDVTIGAGIGPDGTLYATFERRKFTQIATVYTYGGGTTWSPIYERQGYGPGIEPLGAPGAGSSDAAVLTLSGRFGIDIVDAGSKRSYATPSPAWDLDLSSNEHKQLAVRGSASLGSQVYLLQSVEKAGSRAHRVLRLTADRSTMPFYTWDLTTEGKGNLGVTGRAIAVETAILSDGMVLVAYNDAVYDADADAYVSTTGTVIRTNTTAGNIGTVSLPGDAPILDLSAHPAGSGFALATKTGVYWYESAGGSAEELVSYESEKKRVDVGTDGTVVALLDNETVAAWSANGSPLDISDGAPGNYLSVRRSYGEDVAVSDAEGLFYLVGFDNKTLPGGNPVQVAYLEARSLPGGASRWQRFGFDGGDLSDNIADTRLYHVEVAHGELILGGEAAGPQNIFRFDGERYRGEPDQTLIDTHNAPWLSGAAPHLSYVGRFAPDTGRFRNGQVTQTILSDGDYNTLRADAVTIDADGRLYLGGEAAARIANRGAVQIDGTPLAEYAGADPSLLVTNREQTTRHTWVGFSTPDGPTGSVTGLSARRIGGTDYAAALIDVEEGGIYLAVMSADENFEY